MVEQCTRGNQSGTDHHRYLKNYDNLLPLGQKKLLSGNWYLIDANHVIHSVENIKKPRLTLEINLHNDPRKKLQNQWCMIQSLMV